MERLVVEESGVEPKSARWVNPMNNHHTGTYLTPLESWEGAEHSPTDGIGIGRLGVEELHFECWDRQELAMLPPGRHFLF